MTKLLILFLEFLHIGLFSLGGGLATIPFLKELTYRYDWFDLDTLISMIGISESTPGPLGINMATYVGFTTSGLIGSIVAVLGLVIPSIIIIIIIAHMLKKFKESKYVKAAFDTLRPAVIGFVLCAVIDIFLLCFFDYDLFSESHNYQDLFSFINLGLFGIMLIVYKKFKLHPILLIVICAVLGLIFKL